MHPGGWGREGAARGCVAARSLKHQSLLDSPHPQKELSPWLLRIPAATFK